VLLSRTDGDPRGMFIEIAVIAAVFVTVAGLSAWMQQVTVTRYWDGDEYYAMAEQMAAGETPHAAAPYVYRLATPWLVAKIWPTEIVTGFRTINVAAAATTALLLLVWLRRFVAERWARLLAVTLFIVEWHGPARFVSYYPVYVDPLVFPFLILGLILIDSLRASAGDTTTRLLQLTAVCIAGTLCREVMIVVPVALLFARYALLPGGARLRGTPISDALLWLPLAATIGTLALTRVLTHPRLTFSWIDTVIFHVVNKPLYTWVLAWFITFGPVLALVFYDSRRGWHALAERQELAAYLALFGILAYIGGHDTERYLFWSMPVVYLLVARALAAHRDALSHTYFAAALFAAQTISARLFWAIPSPSLATGSFADMPTPAAKIYSIMNRLFVVDDFHWNLWSNFGSRPFHALLLAIYVLFSAAVIAWMRHTPARA
jgi:hypothetical protein